MLVPGCKNVNEIENNRVVTACFANNNGNKIDYDFYVSVPSGGEGGEDSGSKSSAKVYNFKAKNFSDAILEFEKSGAYKVDFTHISFFMGNKKYFDNNFANDEKYIRKYITATPLVYTAVYNGELKKLVESVDKEYNSKPQDFIKNIFSAKSSFLSLTMSELCLSANNPFYTSVVPVIDIKKQGDANLPEIKTVMMYSIKNGGVNLSDNDFDVYNNWRKNYKTASNGYKIQLKNDIVHIELKDKSLKYVVQKYMTNNIDPLNIRYYMKKCFLTYDNYSAYVKSYNLSETKFIGDST